jgi:hypothetical protein
VACHGGAVTTERTGHLDGIFAAFLVIWVVGFVLMIWALVDAIRVPDDSMFRAGTKLIWVLVILLFQLVGAIIYFAVGRPGSRIDRSTGGSFPPPPRPPA